MGQGITFGEAIMFSGPSPWLGILFWTTFSTSILFYLFVLATLLVRPLFGLRNVVDTVYSIFDLDKHPVRCIAIVIAAIVTVIFFLVGAVRVLG